MTSKISNELSNKVHDLVIVSCVSQKIQDDSGQLTPPIPAQQVYTSTYFLANKQYAERFGKQWCILSAYYGFMLPDWPMPRLYNTSWSHTEIVKMKKAGKTIDPAMSLKELRHQALSGNPIVFHPNMEILVLGGKEYVQAVAYALNPIRAVKLLDPLKGLRIGLKIKAVRDARDSNHPFS